MRLTLGELVRRILPPRLVASWFLITVVVTAIGPFATYQQFGTLGRLGYWALVLGVAILFCALAFRAAWRLCAAHPFWLRLLLASALFTAVFLPVQWFIMLTLRGPAVGLEHLVLVVATAPLAVGMMKYLWLDPNMPGPPETAPQPRILDRVTPEKRGTLLHVSVDDHYVELLTDRGKSQILMRFSDAMSELDGVEGMQVHRSHWVARGAVRDSRRRNGKLFLMLVDGSEVPVSRGFQKAVTERGYLHASHRAPNG
ncbi:hisitidine kinase [Defluviimonas sp. 20V17]|uniref:Transcriptional regulator, LytTR family n=1 Tax=Allgaiera indica TaxID=765699 RepID=A0AAN5A0Q5_9RHOB|nr:LytTR family DNA-binding domain-containing protein [Allgaiera indica]KDB05448.1 hisitidine kinase [Defluviimonas sp. 20V17]GHE04703.1 hypothetical protein GCM10008024_32810 [Allgaiera indica]SDX47004.1 transcriptional regulator, LytTR family [Allgaiera indica]